ncbi:MAG: ABC transporter ATP-binding protein [Balneolales bacterium]|nr:ABC transporter ATP-binding protein [Balneolales bacterium]
MSDLRKKPDPKENSYANGDQNRAGNPSPDKKNALCLKSVSKRYGQGKYIIENFSHTFEPGTATGLTGPNGSGKTTLLRLITTAAYPTSGTVLWGDVDIHKNPHQFLSGTGFAFDSSELPQFANTDELLEVILRSRGKWSDEKSPAKINELLSLLQLDERRNSLIGTYSSGMMQKTLLAAALVTEPPLIMLDEPFRALDVETRSALTAYLNKRKKAFGDTIIISSHLPEVVEVLCDSVLSFPLS